LRVAACGEGEVVVLVLGFFDGELLAKGVAFSDGGMEEAVVSASVCGEVQIDGCCASGCSTKSYARWIAPELLLVSLFCGGNEIDTPYRYDLEPILMQLFDPDFQH